MLSTLLPLPAVIPASAIHLSLPPSYTRRPPYVTPFPYTPSHTIPSPYPVCNPRSTSTMPPLYPRRPLYVPLSQSSPSHVVPFSVPRMVPPQCLYHAPTIPPPTTLRSPPHYPLPHCTLFRTLYGTPTVPLPCPHRTPFRRTVNTTTNPQYFPHPPRHSLLSELK